MNKLFKIVLVMCVGIMMMQTDGLAAAKTEEEEAESLLFIEVPVVSVASDKEEKVTDAPGNIKMYPDRELEMMGYWTVQDLMDITSGFGTIFGSKSNVAFIRGLSAGGENAKFLIMIDGVPVNMARNNMAWMDECLTLYGAKRVEFLKGPASALYGRGAFLGVINVVSQEAQADESIHRVKMSLGDTPSRPQRLMFSGATRNENVKIQMSGSYYDRDIREQKYDPDGANDNIYDNLRAYYFNSSFEVLNEDSIARGINPGMIFIARKTGDWNRGWWGVTHRASRVYENVFIPYLKYKRQLSDKLSMSSSIIYQLNDEEGPIEFMDDELNNLWGLLHYTYHIRQHRTEGKVDFDFEWDETTTIKTGLDYLEIFSAGWPDSYDIRFYDSGAAGWALGEANSTDSDKVMVRSVYAQAKKEFPVMLGLNTTIGARYDSGNTWGQLSPRLGLVQKLTEDFNMKLLYGSALMTPNIKHYQLNHDPDIGPEKINTVEVTGVFHRENYNATLTYFNSKMTDPIGRGGAASWYMNMEDYDVASGTELDAEYILTNWKFFVNATMQSSENDDGDKYTELSGMPSMIGAFGALYELQPMGLSVAAIYKYVNEFKHQDTTTPGWNIVDLNIIKRIDSNFSLQLQLLNAMDSDYYYPEGNNVTDFKMWGRTLVASVDCKF